MSEPVSYIKDIGLQFSKDGYVGGFVIRATESVDSATGRVEVKVSPAEQMNDPAELQGVLGDTINVAVGTSTEAANQIATLQAAVKKAEDATREAKQETIVATDVARTTKETLEAQLREANSKLDETRRMLAAVQQEAVDGRTQAATAQAQLENIQVTFNKANFDTARAQSRAAEAESALATANAELDRMRREAEARHAAEAQAQQAATSV